MGTSRSGAELAGKLNRLAAELADTRRPLNAAALAAKQAFVAAEPGVVGHRVARGVIRVRYDIRGDAAVVRFTGPAHLALNPTRPHVIRPRRRRGKRALTVGDGFAAYANHPGTKGKDPGARKAKAAAVPVAARAYREAGLVRPLRRIF
jgi:hypothetical protein